MFVLDGRIVYSASDLTTGSQCEYALLRDLDAKLGRGPAPGPADAFAEALAIAGIEHEQRQLAQLRDEFGEVAVIGQPSFDHAGLTAAAAATRRAVADGVPVIYQAAAFDGRFLGFADFLLRDGASYRVCDAKLARSAKHAALLQVASYADALARAGVPVTAEVELILGDGTAVRHRTDELIGEYRPRRLLVQRLLDDHYAGTAPARWGDPAVQACFRCSVCAEQVLATDDVLLVSGTRVSQRTRLIDAGIHTITDLAGHRGPVAGLAERVTDSLIAQAKIQVRQRSSDVPQFEVIDAGQLAQLPDPDDGDLFFDLESDPLWTTDGTDWGLEYLFGVLEAGPAGVFRPLWAHDRSAERVALRRFLAMVADRRGRYPGMHIYHYAAYERTALLRLANQHSIGGSAVDSLLASGVLVDLHSVVRKSIRVGTRSTGLKALEPLYMGAELRSGEVTTAADSITQYARFRDLNAQGKAAESVAALAEIEDYNRYDCRSTQKLRDWLLQLRGGDQSSGNACRP